MQRKTRIKFNQRKRQIMVMAAILMMALIIVMPAAAQATLDFTATPPSPYGGAQDACGTGAVIEDAGATLHLTGNCWQKVAFPYTVTPNTILEFDFQSTAESDIHGIGFDTDDTINNPIQVFQLAGTQVWGNQTHNTYAIGSGIVHYTIPVGAVYTGSFTSLTFTNDHDVTIPDGESVFSNIQVYEGTPPPPPMLKVNGTDYLVESYGGTQDGASTTTIENDGYTLRVVGNAWKKVGIPYTITPNTVLEFEFSSSAEGEIHGIGFDTDDTINNPIQVFQLSGTQTWGDQTFNNYVTGSGTVHYSIPVGTFYTGNFLSLTFTNDHDVTGANGESVFSRIAIHEGPTLQTFDLYAVSGSTDLPEPNQPLPVSVPVWGYNSTNAPVTQPGGPTLVVNEGDTVAITLHNEIGEDSALFFHGQEMVPDLTGVATGGSKLYSFTASRPGTYLYEAGLLPNTQHQTAMGLYGVLIVRPIVGSLAYDDFGSAYDDEAILLLSEIDPILNTSVDPAAFDMRDYKPRYWMINGKVFPYTDQIPTTAGNNLLLRFVNAGLNNHTMATLGLDQMLLANDAFPFTYNRNVVSKNMGSGETMDVIVNIPTTIPDGIKIPLYDSSLILHNNNAEGFGGMMTFITTADGPPGTDTVGPTTSNVALSPNPTDGLSNVALTADVSDVLTGNSAIQTAEYYINDTAGTAVPMLPTDGTFDSPVESIQAIINTTAIGNLGPGDHTIFVRGQDIHGNWGGFNTITLRVEIAGSGPTTKGLTLVPNPSAGDVIVALSGTADDSATGNSNITGAEWFIGADPGTGNGNPMSVNIPAPIASIDYGITTAMLSGFPEGVQTLQVRSRDAFLWGDVATIDIAIDRTGPVASNVVVAPNPNNGTLPINPSQYSARLDALLTDNLNAGVQSNLYQAEFFFSDLEPPVADYGTGAGMYARDGLYDSTQEEAYAWISLVHINSLGPGNHTIWVHGRDASGNWGAFTTETLVIEQDVPTVTGTTATPNPTNGATLVGLTAVASDAAGSGIVQAEWFVDADPGAGNGTPMTVSFVGPDYDLAASIDVTGWAAGNYTLYTRARDAAGTWSLTDSVVLNVNTAAPVYGVTLAPPTAALPGSPGATVSYLLDVTNTGNGNDTFDITIAGNAWTTTFPAAVGPLTAGASAQISVDVTIPAGALASDTDTVTVTATSQGSAAATASSDLTTTAIADLLYFSTQVNSAVPGVAGTADDADIYSWDGTSFSRIFDASAAGLPGNADIDGLTVVDADTFYMSFRRNGGTNVPGLGPVDDEDIVLYDAGAWSLYFDGNEVGLGDSNGEDIDAIEVLADGSVALSAVGAFNPDPDFPQNRADEDTIYCEPNNAGPITDCTWSVIFDGSDVGLNNGGSEDVNGIASDGVDYYLSTNGNFNVAGLSGNGSDVFTCDSPTPGDATACASFTMYFDGSAEGITDAIDAFDIP